MDDIRNFVRKTAVRLGIDPKGKTTEEIIGDVREKDAAARMKELPPNLQAAVARHLTKNTKIAFASSEKKAHAITKPERNATVQHSCTMWLTEMFVDFLDRLAQSMQKGERFVVRFPGKRDFMEGRFDWPYDGFFAYDKNENRFLSHTGEIGGLVEFKDAIKQYIMRTLSKGPLRPFDQVFVYMVQTMDIGKKRSSERATELGALFNKWILEPVASTGALNIRVAEEFLIIKVKSLGIYLFPKLKNERAEIVMTYQCPKVMEEVSFTFPGTAPIVRAMPQKYAYGLILVNAENVSRTFFLTHMNDMYENGTTDKIRVNLNKPLNTFAKHFAAKPRSTEGMYLWRRR